MDSTSLEKHIRSVIDVENMKVEVIVNCSGFGGYWQVCEDKVFHEIQFDQL
jgi:short-subunit dehydrogenase